MNRLNQICCEIQMPSREKMVVFSIAGVILIMLIIAVSALWLGEKGVEASSKLKGLKFTKILNLSSYFCLCECIL